MELAAEKDRGTTVCSPCHRRGTSAAERGRDTTRRVALKNGRTPEGRVIGKWELSRYMPCLGISTDALVELSCVVSAGINVDAGAESGAEQTSGAGAPVGAGRANRPGPP